MIIHNNGLLMITQNNLLASLNKTNNVVIAIIPINNKETRFQNRFQSTFIAVLKDIFSTRNKTIVMYRNPTKTKNIFKYIAYVKTKLIGSKTNSNNNSEARRFLLFMSPNKLLLYVSLH